ncbi:MAG TPA: glycosyltransferase family 2 protein [Noviherbaspirillum sp.]|nr:glycosyltransferase family 2 protein [Noviherbaspirillum sp.]
MMVTVISPCRNEAAHIDQFLQSVTEQDCPNFELEVIVADGMSDDGTIGKLALWCANHPRIKVIHNPQRIVSTGLNLAIAAASGEIIVRMDIHTSYARDYVRRCVETLRATGAECVGGPWVAEGMTPRQRAIAAAFQSRFGSGGAASRRREYSGPVDTVYLGAWRKADLERLGGFDEDLVRNQDDELCLRIRRAGGTVWQSAAIRSVYTPRASLAALARQFHQYGYWKALVLKKHRIPASLRHIAPFCFIAGLAVLLLAAPWIPEAGLLLAVTAALYLVAALSCAFSARASLARPPIILTAVALFSMHFGYGTGFGRGLVDFILFSRHPNSAMKVLTR